MITCCLHYRIDPYQIAEFEEYASMWLPLVERFGGTHHGYFLPAEGANDVAIALFSFSSLAAYERYRHDSLQDPDCNAAYDFLSRTRCVVSWERSFMRPLLEDGRKTLASLATGTDDVAEVQDARDEGGAEVIDIHVNDH